MGLGKTIQTAAFLQTLANTFGNRGPFLIIAPLSTVYQWHRELSNWTDLNVIIYSGNALDRAMIREFEFAFRCDRPVKLKNRQKYLKHCGGSTTNKVWMVQVVITSPEIMLAKDHDELFSLDWEMLIVDEAHNRLKSNSSKFSKFVRDERFLFRQCLLLTGTPVQNRIDELWTLLNIVDPIVFGDNSYFIERYGSMQGKQRIDELRNIIRPYILRRLKEDVEKDLPSKEETIIEVELTAFQKRFYRAIYEKNFKFLRNNKKGHAHHITNMIMELRKCCNHPFLLEGVEEKAEKEIERKNTNDEADFLIKSSGKLVLLDKLLPKLKDGGHKVLIFSQFKIMLKYVIWNEMPWQFENCVQ
jgi:SNF2 family DNA or RNA helicase